jgi:GntR family transcriptional regulator
VLERRSPHPFPSRGACARGNAPFDECSTTEAPNQRFDARRLQSYAGPLMMAPRPQASLAVGDPLYLRLARTLRDYVAKEGLAPGDRLPPEPDLALTFEVSRVTLRRAVEILVHEGLLVRRQGVGTFVAELRLSEPLIGLHSTRQIARAHGQHHDVRIARMARAKATALEAGHLQINPGDPILRFTRVDLLGGCPVAVAECALPYHLVAQVTRAELQRSSTYELIERRHNIFLTSATQSIRAEGASPRTARLLEISNGAPLLILERVTFDNDGTPVELGKVSYRHDRMECHIELTRQLGGQEETHTAVLLHFQRATKRHSAPYPPNAATRAAPKTRNRGKGE